MSDLRCDICGSDRCWQRGAEQRIGGIAAPLMLFGRQIGGGAKYLIALSRDDDGLSLLFGGGTGVPGTLLGRPRRPREAGSPVPPCSVATLANDKVAHYLSG